ncbi:MAG: TrkA family potassium uptake protein [Candidatus Omnitrophica bacterium]|nr:TrkA family potassium uptake protein [Candidatus Omnitrophota bacterium]
MYIIIVGCGSVGAKLAQDFSLSRDNVVVIDKSRKALGRLSVPFNGRTLIGDAMDLKILQESGISSCDAIFVLTGNENFNLVLGQIAQKMFKVKKVIVQMFSFSKEEAFKKKDLVIINRTNLFLGRFKECIYKK